MDWGLVAYGWLVSCVCWYFRKWEHTRNEIIHEIDEHHHLFFIFETVRKKRLKCTSFSHFFVQCGRSLVGRVGLNYLVCKCIEALKYVIVAGAMFQLICGMMNYHICKVSLVKWALHSVVTRLINMNIYLLRETICVKKLTRIIRMDIAFPFANTKRTTNH